MSTKASLEVAKREHTLCCAQYDALLQRSALQLTAMPICCGLFCAEKPADSAAVL